jgi:hypothetical protein
MHLFDFSEIVSTPTALPGLFHRVSSARFDETIFREPSLSAGSPKGDGWLRRNSNEKMRPMSRKTRIRCPLP